MSAADHLRALSIPEEYWVDAAEDASGIPTLVAALPEIVAVVEAAERIYTERERVPVNHQTGVRPNNPRFMHAWHTRALLERPLAALEEKLKP